MSVKIFMAGEDLKMQAVGQEALSLGATGEHSFSAREVEGIEKVESTVSEGISMTIVTLLSEVDDVDVVLQEVKNEIDSIEQLRA